MVPPPLEQLQFSGEAEAVADSVHYTLHVRNPGRRDVELTSTCDVQLDKTRRVAVLRVYQSSGAGALIFDGSRLPPGVVCTSSLARLTLRARAERSFRYSLAVRQILGDNPDGLYRLAVVPNFDEIYREREVPVGEAVLSR